MSDQGGGRVLVNGVIAVTPQWAAQLAGLSVLQRAVFALERAGMRSIALVAPEGARPQIATPATRRPDTHVRWCAPEALADGPVGDILLLSQPAVLDVAAVEALIGLAEAARPVLAVDTVDRRGLLVATGAYVIAAEAAGELPRRLTATLAPGAEPRARLPAGICYPLGPDAGAVKRRAAEAALLGSLRRKSDGFFAYWFDRRLSTALSRYLVRTPVTPNQISVATLAPGLAGAALIALPGTFFSTIGALLYWLATVLDGCDGEVARLKFMESPRGARLDLLCDNIGLVALFVAIVAHAYWDVPGAALIYAGGAIVGGMVAAMVLEYLLITRPRIRRGGSDRVLTPAEIRRRQLYERLASRDFAYLLPVLAATGALSWFVWATALGVNLFWIALVTVVVRKGATDAVPDARADRP